MPKKGKKGGDGKGAGRTEEEKLLFLQQRAQAEEEMARKKEEILTLFLKDKLQKEERNTAVNLLKLNDGWRCVLRQTRAADLRQEISVLSQTFERQLDAMDCVVKTLELDLQESERQASHVRRVHLQQLERLWSQQEKRLQYSQTQWENKLTHLGDRFNSDRKQLLSYSQQQRSDLQDATFTVEQQHKAVMTEIHRLYGETVDAYESAHEDRKAALVLKSKDKLREKTAENQEMMQLCSRETKKLEHLHSRNAASIQLSEFDVKKVKALQESVIQLRAKLSSSKQENQLVEGDLNVARNQVNQRTHLLRDKLTVVHTEARRELTHLTVMGDKAAKKLHGVIAKGEKVLRVADMCRRLENDQKNISASVFTSEEQRQEAAPGQGGEEHTKEITELHHLTRRINAAVLQREALSRHQAELSRENHTLKAMLRQHLDAMTVSDVSLNGRYALLTVVQAPTITTPTSPVQASSRRHNVIEAVHVARHAI